MDIDKSLISIVLLEKTNLIKVRKSGIDERHIEGDNTKKAWEYICDYYKQYSTTPSIELFQGKTGFGLVPVSDPLEVIIKEIKDRYLWKILSSASSGIVDKINNSDPHGALSLMRESVRDAFKDCSEKTMAESLLSDGPLVWEHYLGIKRGDRGIVTPWPKMDKMTMGWFPGDFIVFVARMGMGKTWGLLNMARSAWLSGKRVLLISTEMSKLRMAIRFYCLHTNICYGRFRDGELSLFEEDKIRNCAMSLMNHDGLYLAGDTFQCTIDDIDLLTEDLKPDILIIDGVYLVKNKGRDKREIVSNTADDLKIMAKSKGIPVIVSSQFNRVATGSDKKTISDANVGITDVLSWNADVMFGMYQSDDMKTDKKMGIIPIKLREGYGSDFEINWDFLTMDFSEINTDYNAPPVNDLPF